MSDESNNDAETPMERTLSYLKSMWSVGAKTAGMAAGASKPAMRK